MIETQKEYNRIRSELLKLESGTLADALLKLAIRSHSACLLVTSLASSVTQNIELFKESIHAITQQTLCAEDILVSLQRALDMLDPEKVDPLLGLDLMACFYETDSYALESSTELDWEFESVYTIYGFEKFVEFARRCTDHGFVVQVVKRLLANDDYYMRRNLLEKASTFLPEVALQQLSL